MIRHSCDSAYGSGSPIIFFAELLCWGVLKWNKEKEANCRHKMISYKTADITPTVEDKL